MPRSRAAASLRGSPEWIARIRQTRARGEALKRLALLDALTALRRHGLICEAVAPFVEPSERELAGWIDYGGGVDRIGAVALSHLEDAALAGLMVRAEASNYLATRSADSASRVPTLMNARRASLAAAGLKPPADELDVSDVIHVDEDDTASHAHDGAAAIESAEEVAEHE